MTLNETILNALNDSDVRKTIQEAIDAKVQELTQPCIESKTEELNELCEQYKADIQKNNQRIIKEQCLIFESNLKKEYNKKYKKFTSEMTRSLNEYVDQVVEEFLSEHAEDFANRRNYMKANAILESLSAVCAMAGVRAEQITEGVEYLNNKKEILHDQRIQNLKEQLLASENANKELTESLDTLKETQISLKENNEKINVLEDTLKEYVRKHKLAEDENNSIKSEFKDLNEKFNQASKQLQNLKKTNRDLVQENNKMLKMGVISEMKQGMSLTESRTFERIAEQIPFEETKQYFDKLEILKDQIMNNPRYKKLNEITGEEKDGGDIDEFDLDRLDHSELDSLDSFDRDDTLGDLDDYNFDNPPKYDESQRWEHLI